MSALVLGLNKIRRAKWNTLEILTLKTDNFYFHLRQRYLSQKGNYQV